MARTKIADTEIIDTTTQYEERDYIEKFDGEASGLTFDPTDTGKAKVVTISDAYTSSVFSAASYSALVTLNGSSRTSGIRLEGNTLKNSLVGGSGSDTLIGNDGNDTLTGGDGSDTFITSLGKNFITDYNAASKDKIVLNSVTPTKVAVAKNNVVITNSDKSTMTIVNGKGVRLNVVDANGDAIAALNQSFGDTEYNATADVTVVDASLNTSLKKIDASNAHGAEYKSSTSYSAGSPGFSKGISIVGNNANNTIYGSNYVDNTIYGGVGKDILIGGSGTQVSVSANAATAPQTGFPIVNTYVFTEGNGNNTIANYQSGDRIQIKSGKLTGYTAKNDDITFNVSLNGKKKTTITVLNGKNKKITFLNPDGTVDTGNTQIYRNSTDFIVTTQATVTANDTGENVKLIDASTSEYTTIVGSDDAGNPQNRIQKYGANSNGIYIVGTKTANTIKGSVYSDTITGGSGKDTLFGGHTVKSANDSNFDPDTFIYYTGNTADVIVDYIGSSDTTKTDIIKLGDNNTTIASSALNTKKGASDVVFTTSTPTGKSKSTLTVKNAQNQMLTIVKSDNTTIAPQQYGATSLRSGENIFAVNGVLDASFNSKAVTLNADVATSAVHLIGNSANNVLVGANSYANTFEGGKGNDTMYAVKGQKDNFLFGANDGTNVIVNFDTSTDVIQLASTDVSISASAVVSAKGANDVQLTIGKSKVIIKGIADTLSGVNAKGKAVTLYQPQKITIAKADGSTYAMNYANTLDKVTDDDIAEGATLDFTGNTLIQSIDAGGMIADIESIAADSSTVMVSSTNQRIKSLHIIGSAKDNTIISAANDGSTTLTSNRGIITTVTGGKGNDVFMLTPGGNMIVTDYNKNAKNEKDKIALFANQVINGSSSETVDGRSDLILEVAHYNITGDVDYVNNITLVGAKDKAITVVDASGAANAQTYGSDVIVIDDKTNSNILVDQSIITVKNNKDKGRKKPINISSTGDRTDTVHASEPYAKGGLSLEGGAGNDTINAGPSSMGAIVTITGGAGKDIFMHNNNKFTEIITDYTAGQDKLEFIEGMEIASLNALNDSDVHLHFVTTRKVGNTTTQGEGDATLLGVGGQKVTLVKERTATRYNKKTKQNETYIEKDETTQIFGSKEIYVSDADGALIDASDAANKLYLQFVDASTRKKPITIRGNATGATGAVPNTDGKFQQINNNTLIGGNGNDTIYSSKVGPSGNANKTEITGNKGADTFVYNGGNVVINDFTWDKKNTKSDLIIFPSDTALTATVTSSMLTADTINCNAANTGRVRFDGNDVIFVFGTITGGLVTDSLTLKNAKDKNITIVDSSGTTISAAGIYTNPYEWRIENNTVPTTLKAVYIDENHTDTSLNTIYTAISATPRSKGATLEGAKTGTNYLITGSKTNDKLIGNEVSNTLNGGAGNDTLQANGGGVARTVIGAANNYLIGGDGNDVFYFNPTKTDTEFDVITDYQVGKDVLRLPDGYYVSDSTILSYDADDPRKHTTLKGTKVSLDATTGDWVAMKDSKKKVITATTDIVESRDVMLTISNENGDEVGNVVIYDAGGYSSVIDTVTSADSLTAVSVPAISAYKISIAQEVTGTNGKTSVVTSSLDLVSTEVVVANADGTTINVTPNPNVVNIVPSEAKPVRNKAMYVIGNSKANSIQGTSKADTLVGGGATNGIDTLTGAVGMDVFMLDGKGDVLITDYSSDKGNYDKVRLGKNVTLTEGIASGSDLIFTYKNANDVEHKATLKGASQTKITIVGSDGKAGAQVYGQDAITVANGDGDKVDVGSNPNVQLVSGAGRTKAVWLVGNKKSSTILGGKSNDVVDVNPLSITGSIKGAYVDAGNGNDSVWGSTGADLVTLGSGDDTFRTNGGNDTVETGAGKDLIIYDGKGPIVVTDYDGKSDRIELQGTYNDGMYNYAISMINYTVNTDTSVVLNLGYTHTTGGNTTNATLEGYQITLKDAGGKNLSITDGQGITKTLTLNDPYTLFVTNADSTNINPAAGSIYTNVDATKRTTSVNITGNTKIAGIKGSAKDDTLTMNRTEGGTLRGGKGNDTLSVGNDSIGTVYYYYANGDGKDVITDYRAGDIIVLGGSEKTTINLNKTAADKNGNYVIAIGAGSITLKGKAKQEILVQNFADIGTTNVTKINTQTTSMKAFDELIDDDNIAGNDDLNEIITPKYQVTVNKEDDEFKDFKPTILTTNKQES